MPVRNLSLNAGPVKKQNKVTAWATAAFQRAQHESGKGILVAVDLIQTHAAVMIVHKSGGVCRPYPLMGEHLTALWRAPGQNYYTLTSES